MSRVGDLLDGYQATCIIVAASRLGVFARLHPESPTTLSELARDLGGVDVGRLRRLMRALSVLGLIDRDGDRLRLTAEGKALRGDGSGLAAAAVMVGEQYLRAWTHLDHSVRTGEPAFDRELGMSVWEHRQQNPAINDAFNRMIAGGQAAGVAAIVDAYDFSAARRVVDVGGGNGHMLAGILARHPDATGVLFDQPHVVDIGLATLARAGLADRCEGVGASFFDDAIPRGGDLYLLQYVLHDWDDAQSVVILGNCRRAMSPGARLLVVEATLPEDRDPPALVMRDLHMMAVLGGCERTLAEYDQLAGAAGLARSRSISVGPGGPDIHELVGA